MFTDVDRGRHRVDDPVADSSEGMVKQAKKNLTSKENVTLAQVDIAHLPYEDQSFDVVVAGNVIHLLQTLKRKKLDKEWGC